MSSSSSNSQFLIPDGYSPPFAIITDDDHTAWIYIATALGLALILLFGLIRVIVRGSICPGVGLDDYFLAASTGFAVIQASVILAAAAKGLGQSIIYVSLESQAKTQQLYYAGILLFVIALGLSKLSLIFFLVRLTSYATHKRIFNGVAVFTTLWTLASFLALALQCQLSHPWLVIGERCTGTRLRWKIICAFDIVTELCMVAMSILLVWNLHAPLSKKAGVISTFAFRLLLIIPIAFRLANFDPIGRTSDFFLAEDLFVVWTQTQLNYSLISATIPTLRIFATTLNTQFGGLTAVERADYTDSYGKNSSQDRERSRGSQDGSMLPVNASGARKESGTPSVSRFSSRQNRYSYNVSSLNHIGEPDEKRMFGLLERNKAKRTEDDEEITPVSDSRDTIGESSNMMIRKEIAYDVEHDQS